MNGLKKRKEINLSIIKNGEKEIIINNNILINFILKKEINFLLKFIIINEKKNDNFNIKINGKLNSKSHLKILIADFSIFKKMFLTTNLDLNQEQANIDLIFSSLAINNDQKKINLLINHKNKKTKATINNYGIALNNSSLNIFCTNNIEKNAKQSVANQKTKIIVFDKNAKGNIQPILKIKENNITASHEAVVGCINKEQLFYLQSRGLSEKNAKKIIIYNHFKKISNFFSYELQNKINKIINKIYV